MKKLIIVADWVDDLLACQEFKTVVEGYAKQPSLLKMSFVNTTSSTIHTAFLINQIQLTEVRYGKPLETVIFVNTDPRIGNQEEEKNGAQFVISRLLSGLYICGPNAGNNFSMIKKYTEKLFKYSSFDEASQFRSRDIYARTCSYLVDELEDDLELEELSLNIIPVLDGHYVGHIDNFGNIKTTILYSELKGKFEFNDEVQITINKTTKKIPFIKGLFSGTKGKLSIYPGSSGEKNDPFMEISLWRDFNDKTQLSCSVLFNNPHPGDKVIIL